MPEREREKTDLAMRLIEATTGKPCHDSIRKRRELGMSFRQIGDEFAISHMTVWRHWKQAAESRE